MTIDPVFGYDPNREDVSNIRDLSDYDKDLYECDRDPNFQPVDAETNTEEFGGGVINIPFFGSDGGSEGNSNSSGTESGNTADSGNSSSGGFRNAIMIVVLIGFVAGAFVVIVAGVLLIRRSRN